MALGFAGPAIAQAAWDYHGGPKAPQSLAGPGYDDGDYAYVGVGPYGMGPYGEAYGGDGVGPNGPVYRYRCAGPATSDCYRGRELQGGR
jgi:hypothetical protein